MFPDFFKSFTLVIAADIGEKSLRRLSEVLWEGKVPLMVVRSYGFIGYIRLQVRFNIQVKINLPFKLQSFLDAG